MRVRYFGSSFFQVYGIKFDKKIIRDPEISNLAVKKCYSRDSTESGLSPRLHWLIAEKDCLREKLIVYGGYYF